MTIFACPSESICRNLCKLNVSKNTKAESENGYNIKSVQPIFIL